MVTIYTNTTVKSDRYYLSKGIINANDVGAAFLLLAFIHLMKHIEQQIRQFQDKLLTPNLIENPDFFRSVWDAVECGIMVLDVLDGGAEYRYAAFNPAFQRISVMPTEALLGKTFKEALPDDIVHNYHKKYIECVRTGKTVCFDSQFWVDGKQTWWSLNVAPVCDKNLRIYQLVITVKDITRHKAEIEERQFIKQALQGNEEHFRNQEQFLRSIYDGAQNSFVVVNVLENGEYQYAGWNKAAEALTGIKRQHIKGKTFEEIFKPAEAAKLQKYHDKCVQQGIAISFEDYFLYEGQTIWLLTQLNPLFDSTGRIYRIVATCIDISERKRIEQALQVSEARFRGLVENANDIIFEYSADNKFTYISPRVIDILGRQASELIGEDTTSDVHPEDVVKIVALAKHVFETGQKQEGIEFRIQHQDGRYIWVTCSLSPVKDSQGNITAMQGILRDIDEKKAAEESLQQSSYELQQKAQYLEQALQQLKRTQAQLLQSEKMSSLGQLVAGVAHEINNPVSFIYSNLEPAKIYINDLLHLVYLYQKYYPNPVSAITEEIETIDLEFIKTDLPKLFSSMKMGADRIKQIVLSLRNFSRMDEAEYKEVNIHEGIDNTLVILEHRIKATINRPAINVTKQYGNLPLVECYAGQLNQVFMNILSNALDALEERDFKRSLSEIEILPSCINILTENIDNKYICIEITDNGSGIPASVQKRLFDPFFMTKPIGKGTGMGLSISYQIVTEKHNGDLQCVSSPGQGTTFVIKIPVKQRRP
ncbi:two-component sensor histidine kinase [Calothrix sp. NIES-4071]|nr:two-component sensor histidine kinase [Calothrix sp. NIES-4071]BAZ63999.1 two-component sensor histidine kinase [Calothrix sp. NIES-4105]